MDQDRPSGRHRPSDPAAGPTPEPAPDLAVALARLARDLQGRSSVQATLDRIVAASTELVDGCTDAGITAVHRGRARPLAVSGPLARDVDRLQADLREGPCFEAARDGTPAVQVPDLARAGDHWPRFAPRARALGVGSMMAVLLPADGHAPRNDPRRVPGLPNLGSLNLYARRPGELTAGSARTAELLACHASVALAAARANQTLQTAIVSRQLIGEAVGILMERHKLTSRQAFALLARTSQDRNVKLRLLAEHLIATGELPRRP
ncbi:ANTAR domain-containing protein [Actinomadura kijaniata]|uniref:GAF domain-containing protein n=1 Tax=Actinomadura kijaniata TaxID=46161 RepID=UPI003F1BFFD9